MGQIPRRPKAAVPLPPPPAPTSRDANPWEMSASRAPSRLPGLRIDPARIPERLKVPPAGASAPPPVDALRKQTGLRWMPIAILSGVLVAVTFNAIESFQRGDFIGALMPLVFVGFVAFGVLRAMVRKRS